MGQTYHRYIQCKFTVFNVQCCNSTQVSCTVHVHMYVYIVHVHMYVYSVPTTLNATPGLISGGNCFVNKAQHTCDNIGGSIGIAGMALESL